MAHVTSASVMEILFCAVCRLSDQLILSAFQNGTDDALQDRALRSVDRVLVLSRINQIPTEGLPVDDGVVHATKAAGLVFVALCTASYPPPLARQFLSQLQEHVTTACSADVNNTVAAKYSMNIDDMAVRLVAEFNDSMRIQNHQVQNERKRGASSNRKDSEGALVDLSAPLSTGATDRALQLQQRLSEEHSGGVAGYGHALATLISVCDKLPVAERTQCLLTAINRHLTELSNLLQAKSYLAVARKPLPEMFRSSFQMFQEELQHFAAKMEILAQSDDNSRVYTVRHLLGHSVARDFWIAHFGDQCYTVTWEQFQSAFLDSLDARERVPEIFNSTSAELLAHFADTSLSGTIDVCTFNWMTRCSGIVGTLCKLMTKKIIAPPCVVGTVHRIQVVGIEYSTVVSPLFFSNVMVWIGDIGSLYRVVPLPDRVGVVLEFDREFDSHAVTASPYRPQCNRNASNGRMIEILYPAPPDVRLPNFVSVFSDRAMVTVKLAAVKERQLSEQSEIEEHILELKTQLQVQLKEFEAQNRLMGLAKNPKERETIKSFADKTLQLTTEFEKKQREFTDELESISEKLSTDSSKMLDRIFRSLQLNSAKVLTSPDNLADYLCTLKGRNLTGRLCISRTKCTFLSRTSRGTISLVIPLKDIRHIERSFSLKIIPEGVYILTNTTELTFTGFADREESFRKIRDLWMENTNSVSNQVVLQAPLEVRGAIFPTWKTRWVVLTNTSLSLFENESSTSAIDIVLLQTIRGMETYALDDKFCFTVSAIGTEITFAAKEETTRDQWSQNVAQLGHNHTRLSQLCYNILISPNAATDPVRDTMRINFDLQNIRFLASDITVPFSALQNISTSLQWSIHLQIANRASVTVYMGSETELQVVLLVLEAIRREKGDFVLPEALKRTMGSVRFGVGELKQSAGIFFSYWLEVLPFGDLIFSEDIQNPTPSFIVNISDCNVFPDGDNDLHLLFPATHHHMHLRFPVTSDRDLWLETFTETIRRVQLLASDMKQQLVTASTARNEPLPATSSLLELPNGTQQTQSVSELAMRLDESSSQTSAPVHQQQFLLDKSVQPTNSDDEEIVL